MPWEGRTPENTQSAHYIFYYKTNKIKNLQLSNEDQDTLTDLRQISIFFIQFGTKLVSPISLNLIYTI